MGLRSCADGAVFFRSQAPAFTVTKDAWYIPRDAVYAAPQERVEYDIVAKNDGNVDLTGVVVTDPMFGGRLCAPFCSFSVDDQDAQCSSALTVRIAGVWSGYMAARAISAFLSQFRRPLFVIFRARLPRHTHNYFTDRRSTGSFATSCASGIPDPWEVDTIFTCNPTYILTQRDINAGIVTNHVR